MTKQAATHHAKSARTMALHAAWRIVFLALGISAIMTIELAIGNGFFKDLLTESLPWPALLMLGVMTVAGAGAIVGAFNASLRPHPVGWGEMQVASLDHALWFHQQSDLSEWHLYVQDSPAAFGGRGFNRGSIYTRDGRLVASAAQDALIRHRPAPKV